MHTTPSNTDCFVINLDPPRFIIKNVTATFFKHQTFLSDQCKEIEENNRMGKTRDLLNEIRDTKGTFHAKMGSIKDKNFMDLTEAEDITKRWQEYTLQEKKINSLFYLYDNKGRASQVSQW